MATIGLRPATSDDYDFVYHVHCTAMGPSVEATSSWDEDSQAHYFCEHLDPATLETIRYNRVNVGVLAVEEREEAFFLGIIEILPAHQRRGIGTTLL